MFWKAEYVGNLIFGPVPVQLTITETTLLKFKLQVGQYYTCNYGNHSCGNVHDDSLASN